LIFDFKINHTKLFFIYYIIYMIGFYTKNNFKNIFLKDNTFKNYFNLISKKEYIYRYNKNNISIYNLYYDNIENFTKKEKFIISSLINSIKNRQNWFFFKLNKNIDRGMPFTISNFIFLPSNILYNNNSYIRDLLIHEQVHIHQHNNLELYNKFYEKCDFKKINTSLENYLKNKYNILTNPDSIDMYIYKKRYIPLIIINGNSHKTFLYNINTDKLESIDLFKKIFNLDNNLSSPHEIFAEKFVHKYIYNL
jgi:hypothetical protein